MHRIWRNCRAQGESAPLFPHFSLVSAVARESGVLQKCYPELSMGSRFFPGVLGDWGGVGGIWEQPTGEWRTAWLWKGPKLPPTASLPNGIAENPNVDTSLLAFWSVCDPENQTTPGNAWCLVGIL